MKYFKNITTAEEIKKQFRAYCVSMHPDKGGDPEEFKQMMLEYNDIIKNFERAKEEARAEEEARKAAEEARKEAEERKRKEEEEARKAAEALREVIAKWSGKLKTVKSASGWIEKPTADYLAAVKYNIKQILNKYFPGVVFKVSLRNKTWSASAEIFWTDGPSTKQVEEVEELNLFISHYHTSSPYEDYGHDEEMKSTRAWRNQYGQISADRFEFTRTFSDLGKAEVLAKIYEAFPQFEGMTKKSDAAFISFDDALHLCQLLGFHHKETGKAWADLSEEEREKKRACDDLYEEQRKIIYDLESSRNWYNKNTSLSSVIDAFLKVYTVSEETTRAAAEAAAAPVFEAKHGATWQAIKKALGANVFCMSEDKEITIPEAAEMVAKGEKVYLGKPAMYDGERCIYGVNCGGAKVQQKRADKFAAVGIQISNYGYNSYKDVEILQFAADVLAELRKDAEKVEQQRKEWEEEQKNGKQTAHKADHSQKAAEGVDLTAAPADGLELVEIAGGVAVVGDQRATYKNRKAIKAHGAIWNKEAQQWQATTAEAVESLREWFGMTEQQDETTAADAETCEQVEAVGVLASALSFLVGAIVSATEKANEALKKAAAEAAKVTAKFEAEHRAEERKEAAAILREQIKKVSEQVASLSDTLAQMQERLNALESGQDVSEEATEEPQMDATAQSRPKGGSGSGVDLSMLQEAAKDVQRLTWESEYIKAALAELYALCACGVSVVDLIDETKALAGTREPLGVVGLRCASIRHIAENRAKAIINIDVLHALFSLHDTKPGSDEAA
jgi:curved DNA-binding protein CbpA